MHGSYPRNFTDVSTYIIVYDGCQNQRRILSTWFEGNISFCCTVFSAWMNWLGVLQPQIYKGDSRPCIQPCVMALSAMGLKLGVFGILPTTHTNQTQNKYVHDLRAQFYTCLSSRADRSRCRWDTHPMKLSYFDYRKNLNTPNLNPMLG